VLGIGVAIIDWSSEPGFSCSIADKKASKIAMQVLGAAPVIHVELRLKFREARMA